MRKTRSALTIAGSDSSGGAGIQADLKAFSLIGVHGASVITNVTSQNTRGVEGSYPLPEEVIRGQLRAVLSDLDVGAAKTGMLYSSEIVELVAGFFEDSSIPLVVDPVMVATVNDPLCAEGFLESLKKHLLPKAEVVTPNIPEAEALSGMKIGSEEDIKNALKVIHDLGTGYVVIKGGHFEGEESVDYLFDGKESLTFAQKRLDRDVHGSGCTFSALITGYLVKGTDVKNALRETKTLMGDIIRHSYKPGKGVDVAYLIPSDRYTVLKVLNNSVEVLVNILPPELVPEVGINFGYALENAEDVEDICAVDGRITRSRKGAVRSGQVDFRSSGHVARIILAAMAHDPSYRSALNLRFSDRCVESCREAGLSVESFSRDDEPESVSSTSWGTDRAIRTAGRVPDVIFDLGAVGKEPMIRVLGKNPEDVLLKVKRIIDRIDG